MSHNQLPALGIGVEDAAKMLGITVPSLRRLQREGEIPFAKVGGRVLFRPDQLESYLERKESEIVTKQNSEDILMTKKEAMKRFGVGKYRLEYLIQDGVVPIIKFGYRTVRIPVKEATESILALARGGDAR